MAASRERIERSSAFLLATSLSAFGLPIWLGQRNEWFDRAGLPPLASERSMG
jgi:hypothetical protein